MRTLELAPKITEAECEALLGTKLDESHYDTVVTESTRMETPDGKLIGLLVKGAIPREPTLKAFRVLDQKYQHRSKNRGTATGKEHVGFWKKKDGTVTKTRVSLAPEIPVNGIIGFFDRSARFPYCRQTAFSLHNPKEFAELRPYVTAVAETFREHVPDRYAAQKAAWDRASPDFKIPESVFSTLTVNKNFQTACHLDVGDLKEGFSCLGVMRKGVYEGGYFVLPRYRVAIAIDSTDLALIDPHEYHGNSPIVKVTAGAERISMVLYFRTRILECGSAAEELARVQERREGEPLHDDE